MTKSVPGCRIGSGMTNISSRAFFWRLMNLMLVFSLALPIKAHAERLKDISNIAGVRSNQLLGYGLVVGLDGTGDQTTQTPFTVQSLKSMLARLGVAVPPGVNPQLTNVAAVMVQAQLPPFANRGQTIDVTVSSLGNAGSLRGGSLLMTPLKGADGKTYALAQGNLVVGGFGGQGADGSRVTVNIPSSGRIPNGATVEVEIDSPFDNANTIELNLFKADFTTAARVTEKLNEVLGVGTAQALDASSIRVMAPDTQEEKVAFVSFVENIEIEPAKAPAKVIVNSRTGTVVIGSHVRLDPAAVSHGSLTVTISENLQVSQPAPFTRGGQAQTVVTPNSDVRVQQEDARMFVFDPGVSLDELVRAVNGVGAAPGDLVAILEALERVGALHAQLVVI